MNILVVEDRTSDFEDIEICLPNPFHCYHTQSINAVDVTSLLDDYILLISDIFDRGLSECDYRRINVFSLFRKRIKKLSELQQKFGCNLIIITKLPLKHLREYFGLLEDDPDVNRLFVYAKLMSELNSHKSSEFSLYEHGNIRMVTKPGHEEITDKIVWQNWFKGIVNEICAPYNTYIEKKGN